MEKVAIIGTGIAGMSAAAKLHPRCDITLFERNAYVGGHTNTVELETPKGPLPVDTGFMVYNEVTYPRLTRLFAELGVETQPTDMSFALHNTLNGYTWSSRLARNWYKQGRTLLQPRFWRMLAEVVRFNRLATEALAQEDSLGSLGDFLDAHRFSALFVDNYLVPTTAAIWSTPHDSMHGFPAATLFRFLSNHGLLGLRSHHPWRTVVGGSRQYREKLIAPFADRIRTSRPAKAIKRSESGVLVADSEDNWERFDRVILAAHADESLALLEDPTPLEKKLLRTFEYSRSDVLLHRDTSVLAPREATWASWNYRLDSHDGERPKASTHYWMNALQALPGPDQYIVSLNTPAGLIDQSKVDWSTTYHHPTFSEAAIAAQKVLPKLNRGRVFFAGSYFRYGFHEDALMAGQDAADALLAQASDQTDDALLAI